MNGSIPTYYIIYDNIVNRSSEYLDVFAADTDGIIRCERVDGHVSYVNKIVLNYLVIYGMYTHYPPLLATVTMVYVPKLNAF